MYMYQYQTRHTTVVKFTKTLCTSPMTLVSGTSVKRTEVD